MVNKTIAPNSAGHQSFRNCLSVFTLSLFFGLLSHFIKFVNALPSRVKTIKLIILSRIPWTGASNLDAKVVTFSIPFSKDSSRFCLLKTSARFLSLSSCFLYNLFLSVNISSIFDVTLLIETTCFSNPSDVCCSGFGCSVARLSGVTLAFGVDVTALTLVALIFPDFLSLNFPTLSFTLLSSFCRILVCFFDIFLPVCQDPSNNLWEIKSL